MSRLTPEWTKYHSLVALSMAPVAVGTSVAAWAEEFWLALAIALLLLLTAAVGLAFDPLLSLVVGLAGASGMVLLKQISAAWTPERFLASLAEVVFFLAAAVVAGFVGQQLRRLISQTTTAVEQPLQSPAVGSLGFLPSGPGEMRVEEELDRAKRYRRELSVLRVAVDVHPEQAADAAVRDGVVRAVGRLLESQIRIIDVPYADDENCFVAILPETSLNGALVLASHMVDAVANATLAVGSARDRRSIGDFASIRFGVASYPEHGDTAAELINTTRRAIDELNGHIELAGAGGRAGSEETKASHAS